MTLRKNLVLWFSSLIFILLFTSEIVSFLYTREHLYDAKRQEVFEKAKAVNDIINAIVYEIKKDRKNIDIKNIIPFSYINYEKSRSFYDNTFFQFANTNNKIIVRSTNLEKNILPILELGKINYLTIQLPDYYDKYSRTGRFTSWFNFFEKKSEIRIIYYCERIIVDNKVIGTYQVAISLLRTERIIRKLILFRICEILLATFISFLLGIFLSKKAVTPMVKITNDVKNMEGQDLSIRLQTESLPKDEIGELAKTFNQLLERISKSFEIQNRFISDSSHELRSPITSIKGHAQLVLKRGWGNLEIFNESLETILRESDRLVRLVDDLLFIALSEVRPFKPEPIDIVKLTKQVVADLQPLYNELKHFLPESPIIVNAEPDAIKRVIINLIDNSLRSIDQKNGQILVSLNIFDNNVYLSVKDNGCGISSEHLPNLFERFYRVDTARDRNKGGSGLGLSIINEIIKQHSGKIEVESEIGVKTEFTVILPLFNK